MPTLRYAVLRFEDEWKVVSAERRMGHFASQALAMHAGARLAREAIAAGHEVELLLQDSAARLLPCDVLTTAAHIDALQGGTAQPADEGPPQPGTRALEL